jgi:hypothetical protein
MSSIKQTYSLYYNDSTIDDEIKQLVHDFHYSKSSRSQQQKHVFKLVDTTTNDLIGAAIYGNPMSRHFNKLSTIELRRLCLIDNTPKNTESYFIGLTLRWLGKNTSYEQVVSFADPNHGHTGTIYKASNFLYDGREKNGNPRIVQYGDKQIHLRQMYQKAGGSYSEDAKRIQAAVASGEATVMKQEQKHRFIYNLRG